MTPLGRRGFYRSLTTWLRACRAEKLKTQVLGAPANYRSIQNEDKVSLELEVSGKCDLIQKKIWFTRTFFGTRQLFKWRSTCLPILNLMHSSLTSSSSNPRLGVLLSEQWLHNNPRKGRHWESVLVAAQSLGNWCGDIACNGWTIL